MRPMRKTVLLATALMFTGANLAFALPAAPVGTAGQGLSALSDGEITLVTDNKKAKKAKKSSKKSDGGGGMNMKGMPPGHKM